LKELTQYANLLNFVKQGFQYFNKPRLFEDKIKFKWSEIVFFAVPSLLWRSCYTGTTSSLHGFQSCHPL